MKKVGSILSAIFLLFVFTQVNVISCKKSCHDTYRNKISDVAKTWRAYNINQSNLCFFSNNLADSMYLTSSINCVPQKEIMYSDRESHSKCENSAVYTDIYVYYFKFHNANFEFQIGERGIYVETPEKFYRFVPENISLDTAKIGNIIYDNVYKYNANNFVSREYGILKFDYKDTVWCLQRY